MPKYVLDTALYIRATRDNQWSEALEAFYSAFAPFLHLHSVVAAELLTGAVRPELEEKTQRSFIAPFEATGRVITPEHGAWKRAGRIVARLVREKMLGATGITRSFLNDCLIAATARDHGFVLVTENTKDFDLIRTVVPFEFVAPWPTGEA